MEIHSELQKKFDDFQNRVQELKIDLVTEESKVSNIKDSMKRLREESEKELQRARESEAKLRSDLDKLQSEMERCRAQMEAEVKARALAEAQVKAEAQARALAEAKVKAADEELEGIAIDAVYLAWMNNRSMDLTFLEDPSALARFETRLSAEASAAAQARQAVSEGRVPEVNPIVEIEADVPPAASNIPVP